jgi:hypothetical protein
MVGISMASTPSMSMSVAIMTGMNMVTTSTEDIIKVVEAVGEKTVNTRSIIVTDINMEAAY